MDPQARLVLRNRPRMVQGWGTALQMSWHRCLGTRARAHFQRVHPKRAEQTRSPLLGDSEASGYEVRA